jgi:RNA polymerase sigma-70 factor, ECF subfamily
LDVTKRAFLGLYKMMDVDPTGVERAELFTRLFEAHHTKVLAYARRRLGVDAADDAVADTFLAAWNNLERLSGDPLIWLYSLARGAVSHHRRRLGRIAGLNERSSRLAFRGATPDHAEFIGWQDPFNVAFARLRESDREVLRIAIWEGLKPSEAAVVLGCSAVAFKVRLHRARRELRCLLDADQAGDITNASSPAARQPSLDESCVSYPLLRPGSALEEDAFKKAKEIS